ncbi:MAG TPA: DUF1214 domain-containing protein [Gemmatimonadaceae bacterium]|jgi:hypothetical protein|nr:DUF1214 domain-containing protein [Gemmatimonadaceae bacterium]
MSDRAFRNFVILIGAICGFTVIRHVAAADSITLRNALIQGIFVGYGFAVVTIEIVARRKMVRVNGWITAFDCGLPSNGMFTRAAHTRIFPGPINVPEEAMYWRTTVDEAGHALSGEHDYVLHFPPGGLPPADAFWSLTMADAKERFVANPLNRYVVGDRSNLEANADGSVDVYVQTSSAVGRESNWLPAPPGNFKLWLRAYVPRAAILDGKYLVPPVVKTR